MVGSKKQALKKILLMNDSLTKSAQITNLGLCNASQKQCEDFAKFCGLLRINELWNSTIEPIVVDTFGSHSEKNHR